MDEAKPTLDLDDVRFWFARSAKDCIEHPNVQEVLRSFDPAVRAWIMCKSIDEIRTAEELKHRDEQLARQHLTWWEDVETEIREAEVPASLVARMADYLAGYVLVRDLSHKITRPAKRLCRDLGISLPPSARPPHRESLRARLIRLMTGELIEAGVLRKNIPLVIARLFQLVRDPLHDERLDPASISRIDRRSRRRGRN
jgi:hypothetical protein